MKNHLSELTKSLDKLCHSLEWQIGSMESIGECANRKEVLARDLSQTVRGFKTIRTIAKQVLKHREYDSALNIRQNHLTSMIQLLHTLNTAVRLLESRGLCSNWTLDTVKDVYVGMRYGLQELFKTIVKKL